MVNTVPVLQGESRTAALVASLGIGWAVCIFLTAVVVLSVEDKRLCICQNAKTVVLQEAAAAGYVPFGESYASDTMPTPSVALAIEEPARLRPPVASPSREIARWPDEFQTALHESGGWPFP